MGEKSACRNCLGLQELNMPSSYRVCHESMERANLKTDVSRKQSTPNFPKIWSNTLKQFVGCCRQVVWVYLTILCGSGHIYWRNTCAYEGLRNVRFLENLSCFIFLKHPFWDLPFCLITDKGMKIRLVLFFSRKYNGIKCYFFYQRSEVRQCHVGSEWAYQDCRFWYV